MSEITVSPVERVMHESGAYGHDEATVTGANGTTKCTGCFGVSESGQYRVFFTWKYGAARLGSSTVVAAESGIAAAIAVATHVEGGYLSAQAGTVEAS